MASFRDFPNIIPSIRVPHPTDNIELLPRINVRTCEPSGRGLCEYESLLEKPIEREFLVTLRWTDVADWLYHDDPKGTLDPRSRAVWKHLRTLLTKAKRFREDYDRGRFVVARLRVSEFPVLWWLDLGHHGWLELDGIDGDCSAIVAIAEYLSSDEFRMKEQSFALGDGSLFYLRNLEVHPAFRGQQIGGRLLVHALAHLPRCGGDVAVGLVRPYESAFGEGRPQADKRSIDRLVRYYQRLGMTRWRQGKRYGGDEYAMIYALIGECYLKPRGLPTADPTEPNRERSELETAPLS